jgi:hypothetical protein
MRFSKVSAPIVTKALSSTSAPPENSVLINSTISAHLAVHNVVNEPVAFINPSPTIQKRLSNSFVNFTPKRNSRNDLSDTNQNLDNNTLKEPRHRLANSVGHYEKSKREPIFDPLRNKDAIDELEDEEVDHRRNHSYTSPRLGHQTKSWIQQKTQKKNITDLDELEGKTLLTLKVRIV